VRSDAEVWASDSDFNGRETNRNLFWNFLATSQAVFDMQADSVFNIFNSFLVGVALTVATLKCGTRNKISVGVGFNDDWES